MPVIIEFSRCIGTYSSAKFEYIIKKARDVFKIKGFVNVTMQDIEDECQISRGGLYKYFATTSEIFEEVLKFSQKDMEIIEELVSNQKGFFEIMQNFLKDQMHELLYLEDSIRVATYEYFINQRNDKTKMMIQDNLDKNIFFMEQLINYGLERKEIKKIENVNTIAIQMVAWLEGLNLISIVTDVDEKVLMIQFEHILNYFK